MSFDFSKLKAEPKRERITDPISLFQDLRVTDKSINDLWLAQGDALREWNQNRTQPDISISLNTGAGKTLVGLLVGQSLVNELRSLVVYACSSLQLVEQTAKKAEGYGLPVSTYTQGTFNNNLAMQGDAICITTYQAIFNGKSIFRRQNVGGIVFDDAHAAEHLLRDHFSLRVSRDKFPNLYDQIHSEFTNYFYAVGAAASYDAVTSSATSSGLLLAPPSEVNRAHTAILKYLINANVPSEVSTTFAWEYLKDRIDLCSFVISGSEVTITPAFVPVRTLPYFGRGIRRVYLSATLSAEDIFCRTFGRNPSVRIAPKTTAGECERMILVPARVPMVDNDVTAAQDIIAPHKALILVPSYQRANVWADIAHPPQRENTAEEIEKFKSSTGNEKLLLTARYDGMDLPGDMCRVIVIDDLPSGLGPLETFLWENISFAQTLRSAIASRVVQSLGRISRGMSDHGIVILTGKRLIDWLFIPNNQKLLPRFLQKQLQLGIQMSEQIDVPTAIDAVGKCLSRDETWVSAYEKYLKEASTEEPPDECPAAVELALAEAKFAESLWNREYADAARYLSQTLDQASDFSLNTLCWHKLWLGYSYELGGNMPQAIALYQQAHAGQRNIPPYYAGGTEAGGDQIKRQILNAARQFESKGDGRVRVPYGFHRDLLYLNGNGTSAQTEEAVRCLGQYLGFESTRPDKEFGTGPDIMWLNETKTAICLDAKTDKIQGSAYTKHELGQMSDHVQWIRDNTVAQQIIPGFVGQEIGATESANPPEGYKVVDLTKLYAVGETLKSVYQDIADRCLLADTVREIQSEFDKRRLLWPDILDTLEMVEIRSLM